MDVNSIPLACVSILVPVSHSLANYRLVVHFEIGKCLFSHFCCFFPRSCRLFLDFYIAILILASACQFMQKFTWNFNSDSFETVDLPNSIGILTILTFLIHEYGFVFYKIIFHSMDATFLHIMSG